MEKNKSLKKTLEKILEGKFDELNSFMLSSLRDEKVQRDAKAFSKFSDIFSSDAEHLYDDYTFSDNDEDSDDDDEILIKHSPLEITSRDYKDTFNYATELTKRLDFGISKEGLSYILSMNERNLSEDDYQLFGVREGDCIYELCLPMKIKDNTLVVSENVLDISNHVGGQYTDRTRTANEVSNYLHCVIANHIGENLKEVFLKYFLDKPKDFDNLILEFKHTLDENWSFLKDKRKKIKEIL